MGRVVEMDGLGVRFRAGGAVVLYVGSLELRVFYGRLLVEEHTLTYTFWLYLRWLSRQPTSASRLGLTRNHQPATVRSPPARGDGLGCPRVCVK